MTIARHARGRRTAGRLVGPAAAVLAVSLGGALFGYAELHGTSSAPVADRAAAGPRATTAARLPAVVTGPVSSTAASSTSTHPAHSSHAAGKTSTPATSTAGSRAPRTSAALALRPTVIASLTARSSSAARPRTARLVIAIPLPHHALAGSVWITMPANWTILGMHAAGGALRTSGDGVHEGTWRVLGGSVSVTVSGPSGSNEVMSVHVSSLGGSADESYRLS